MSAVLGFLVLWGLRRELLCRDFDNGPQEGKVQAAWGPCWKQIWSSNDFRGKKENFERHSLSSCEAT